MKWNADAFFAQGKTHPVCEDYAVARAPKDGNDALTYAIVCDGCSSSPSTDVGARLLAHSAALHMGWLHTIEPRFADREKMIIDAAANAANEIDVDMRCLDSTLLAAYRSMDEDGNKGVRVSLRGDGVIVARSRTHGTWYMFVIEHEHNAPRYLSYDLQSDRLSGYMAKFGDRARVRIYNEGIGWTSEEGIEFNGHHDDWFFPAYDHDLVIVMSDGVMDFQRLVRTGTSKMLDRVPTELVVEQLLKIKGTTGAFLQRRCHKFISKYCALNEWQHSDDFSAAAIWMGEPEP